MSDLNFELSRFRFESVKGNVKITRLRDGVSRMVSAADGGGFLVKTIDSIVVTRRSDLLLETMFNAMA